MTHEKIIELLIISINALLIGITYLLFYICNKLMEGKNE